MTAANVKVDLGPAHITSGGGTIQTTSAGLTARLTGTLAFDLPGFAFTGDMGVSIDTSKGYIRVDGKGVKLKILGQELTGDFSVERATADDGTAVTAIVAANVSYRIGSATAGASLTNGHGALPRHRRGPRGRARRHDRPHAPGRRELHRHVRARGQHRPRRGRRRR